MEYLLKTLEKLISIPSPSGFTKKAQKFMVDELTALGYEPWQTRKGNVLACLGGEGRPVVLAAHIDTLGGIVAEIREDGNLRIDPIGGLAAPNVETENFTVYPRLGGKPLTATLQMPDPSLHVNTEFRRQERNFKDMVLFLDAKTSSVEETEALGIHAGDFACAEPRFTVTGTGYIKSRFLDDKLHAAMLLDLARRLKEENVTPARKVYVLFTTYEEVGHGCAAGLPEDMEEIISVDMGCVGEGLRATDRMVGICSRDSVGPYDFDVTNALILAAQAVGAPYGVDSFPNYSSDADVALRSGRDVRHACFGAALLASHGYERVHIDAVRACADILWYYIRQ